MEQLRQVLVFQWRLCSTRASKLPRIELTKPDHVVGKSTVAAMQAGIVYGYVGQVDGIVARMKAQSKEEADCHRYRWTCYFDRK